MQTIKLSPEEISIFKNKALEWAVSFETACSFDSHSYPDPYSSFDFLIAAGVSTELECNYQNAFEQLDAYISESPQNLHFGFLSYDLKNDVEDLLSKNPDKLKFPDLYFFKPQHLITIKNDTINIQTTSDNFLIDTIKNYAPTPNAAIMPAKPGIKSRFSYSGYLNTVEKIKEHILRGDIYEMNLCQEFYAENVFINPLETYKKLTSISPTPFSAFFKFNNKYILSASPERFLCRRGEKLISQPIKGTSKRSTDSEEDKRLKEALKNNIKEQSENVMIVDLVRNDLTKCSKPGSVKVEELFGIYSFKQVHQMISTVVSEAEPNLSNTEIIKATFPMGSMTGAPKVRAMQLIEQFETSKRSAFSGALGYLSADGDFDLNVLIRSLFYNAKEEYLSFQVGSAITYASEAKKEYEECLLKAEAILQALA